MIAQSLLFLADFYFERLLSVFSLCLGRRNLSEKCGQGCRFQLNLPEIHKTLLKLNLTLELKSKRQSSYKVLIVLTTSGHSELLWDGETLHWHIQYCMIRKVAFKSNVYFQTIHLDASLLGTPNRNKHSLFQTQKLFQWPRNHLWNSEPHLCFLWR